MHALTRLTRAALIVGASTVACASTKSAAPSSTPQAVEKKSAVADADKLAATGHYSEALDKYLSLLRAQLSLEERSDESELLTLLESLSRLRTKYAPSNAALRHERARESTAIVRAATEGRELDESVTKFFVRFCVEMDDEKSLFETYEVVKRPLAPGARIRRDLWTTIEGYLVEHRRYAETLAERDVSLAAMRYYVAVFKRIRPEDEVKHPVLTVAIEYSVKHEGGTHFEALLGGGDIDGARAFSDELLAFRPTERTFCVLIEHAVRGGALEEAERLKLLLQKRREERELELMFQ